MKTINIAEYKGIDIYYNETTNVFGFKDAEGVEYTANSLRAARTKITTLLGDTESAKKQPERSGLLLSGWTFADKDFSTVRTGSFGYVENWRGEKDLYVWLKGYRKNERTRHQVSDFAGLFEDTPNNKTILKQYIKNQKAHNQEVEKLKARYETSQEELLEKATRMIPTLPDNQLPIWEK